MTTQRCTRVMLGWSMFAVAIGGGGAVGWLMGWPGGGVVTLIGVGAALPAWLAAMWCCAFDAGRASMREQLRDGGPAALDAEMEPIFKVKKNATPDGVGQTGGGEA